MAISLVVKESYDDVEIIPWIIPSEHKTILNRELELENE